MTNKVILIGNVGKDIELKETKSQKNYVMFSVATKENYKKEDKWETKTEWHDIVAWGKLAGIIAKYAGKGTLVYVEGKLTHRKYDDKDGVTKYVTEVVCDTFKVLDKKKDSQPQTQDAGLPSDEDDLPF